MKRTVAVVVTSVVVVGGLAGLASYDAHDHPAGLAPSAASTGPTSDDANRAAAKAEVQRLMAETPLPAGAVTSATAPTALLVHQTQGGPLEQDTTLDRVAWWTVPVSTTDFAAYLAAHTPRGLTPSGGVSTGTLTDTHAGTSQTWAEQNLTGTGTRAYTPPELWVTWTAYDGGTAVRAEGYIGARWQRPSTSYVAGRIQRIDVRITGRGAISQAFTARGPVRRLRFTFNGLLGAVHNEGKALSISCNGMLTGTTTVVFHLLHGHLVRIRDVATGCGDGLEVWRNGRRVPAHLDPSGFATRVAAIAK